MGFCTFRIFAQNKTILKDMNVINSLLNMLEEIIKSIATTLLVGIPTVIALYVAIKQYYLSKHQLKIELYEKRYKIYIATKEFVKKIDVDVKKDDFIFQDFKPILNEAKFLFHDDISAYLKELVIKAKEYRNYEKDLIKLQYSLNPEGFKDFSERISVYIKYFSYEYYENGVESKFAAYLNLSTLENTIF